MASIYLNGELVPEDRAVISAQDRGVLFGDGAFETLRAYSGRILRLPEHLGRMRRTLEAIELDLPVSDEELSRGAYGLIEANRIPEARLRLTVTGGRHTGIIRLKREHPPNVIMTGIEVTLPPESHYRDGVRLVVSRYSIPHDSPLARVKTTARLMNLMAKEEALAEGAFDSLFLDDSGRVLEGTSSNFFFIRDETLCTASLETAILPGVTRDLVLEAADNLGLPIHEGEFSLGDLKRASEAFVTSTTIELLPVSVIAGERVGQGGPGPWRPRLNREYRRIVESELEINLPAPPGSAS